MQENNLNGYLGKVDDNIRKMMIDNSFCANCSKPIKQKKKDKVRRFCSDEYRRKLWKKNADKGNRKEVALHKVVCAFCEKEFISYGNKNRKYCSHECYIKDRSGGNKTINVKRRK